MPRLLNAQHEAFCRAYVRGPCAGLVGDAYEAAGYKRDSGNASRLFLSHDVKMRIAELQQGDAAMERHAVRTALADAGIDKARIVKELAKIAFANAFDYVDTEGHVDLSKVARDKGTAVRDIEVEWETNLDGKARVKKLKVKLYDKRMALRELAKHIDEAQEPSVWGQGERRARRREEERNWAYARLRDDAEQGEDVMGTMAGVLEDAGLPVIRPVMETVMPRHCEEARSADEAIQAGKLPGDDQSAKTEAIPSESSALDCFVAANAAPRNDGAAPVIVPVTDAPGGPGDGSTPAPSAPLLTQPIFGYIRADLGQRRDSADGLRLVSE